MKTNFVICAAIAAASVVATACNKDLSDSLKGIDYQQYPISLRAFSSVPTRSAVSGTSFPEGYDMLVSAYRTPDSEHKGGDVASNYFEGVHFTKDASGGTWKECKYWPLTGTLDFLCVASAGLGSATNGIVPAATWGDADGNASGKVVLTVPDNSEKFDDLLYGALNGQSYVATGNPVIFNHANSAVAFTAKTNVTYDATKNTGITIDSISVDGAKYSGTLTIENKDTLTAVWSGWGTEKDHVFARVWSSEGKGIKADEPRLTGLNVTSTASTAAFGDGYVILPAQEAARKITVHYTIHNGKDSDGASLDNHLQYQHSCAETWAAGKKYIYAIAFSLNEITIAPTVTDWAAGGSADIAI